MAARSKNRPTVFDIPEWTLECRALGHAWKYFRVTSKGSYHVQVVLCSRCDATRLQTISRRTGIIKQTRIKYNKGYVVVGLGYLSKEERGKLRLRAEQLFLHLAEDSNAEV